MQFPRYGTKASTCFFQTKVTLFAQVYLGTGIPEPPTLFLAIPLLLKRGTPELCLLAKPPATDAGGAPIDP